MRDGRPLGTRAAITSGEAEHPRAMRCAARPGAFRYSRRQKQALAALEFVRPLDGKRAARRESRPDRVTEPQFHLRGL